MNIDNYVIILVPSLGLVVTPLPIDQEVLSSISGFVVGFFSSGQLFHNIYGLGASVFQFP